MKAIEGRTALVTGAGRGLGRCIAARLLEKGGRVALVDVQADVLAATAESLAPLGACRPFACDISDPAAVRRLADDVEAALGPVRILVNNAGIVRAADLLELGDDDIARMIQVNLTAHFWTCRTFLPGMQAAGEGHIVNIASAGGLLAIPRLTAYCASKFGVVGFSDALRQEIKKNKWPVGVTCVCPNTVDTGMFAGSRTVRGTRLLTPEKVAAEVVRAILRDRPLVGMPSFPVKVLTPLLKALLPVNAMDRLNALMGMWHINDGWTGGPASPR